MARLPQPGGDNGDWGTILNDYLSQAHDGSGLLKSDSVGADQIQNDSVTLSHLESSIQASLDKADSAVQPGSITINVKDYGAKGDGTTDDTAAIAAAVSALPVGAGLYVPAGTYPVTAWPSMPDQTTIRGEGPEVTTIRRTGWGDEVLIRWTGSLAGAPLATTTADISPSNSQITVNSTASLVAGGWYILGTNTDWSTVDTNMRRGELIQVATIQSATQFLIHGQARDRYSVAGVTTIRPIQFKRNVGISNLSVVDSQPGTHQTGLVQFYACQGVHARNIKLVGCNLYGLQFNAVHTAVASDCNISEGRDDVANGYTGYGINISRCAEDIAITGCRFNKLRHGVTTGSSAGAYGVPRNVVVSGCTASQMTNAAFDTHPPGANITFTGCSATSSQIGFQLRSKDSRIIGCSISHCNDGIQLNNDCAGSSVVSCVIRSLKSSSAGRGIVVAASPDRVLIQGNAFENYQGYGIIIGSSVNPVRVLNNSFSHLGGDNTRKTAIWLNTSTGKHVIVGNTFIGNETATNSEQSVATTQMDYAVDLGTGDNTGTVIARNTAIGLAQGLTLNSTNATIVDNSVI